MSKNTSYFIYAVCDNCDLCEQVKIPKGILIKDFECINCKCKTLKKINLTETDYGGKGDINK